MPRDVYQSPFSTRYASREMQHLFSEEHKFRTWRRLWVALAEAEQAEGLAITNGQIAELKAHINDVNYEDAMRREAQCRHDVMSHVYAYGLQCPGAKGIIHLGATSCYVGDNTDLLIMRDALALLHKKLLSTMQPTFACCKALKRWKNPSRRGRLARPPCRTSATPCGANAFARWRAM